MPDNPGTMEPVRGGPAATGRRDAIVAASLGACVAAIQAVIAVTVLPPAAQFVKYSVAARLLLAGTMPLERFFDFSPLYLLLHAAALRGPSDPGPALTAAHLLLTGGAAAFLFLILRRFVPLPLAAAGVGVLAAQRGLMVYGCVFEPEALVLFLLTGVVWLVLRDGYPSLVAGGCFLAALVLTRPSYLPLALLPLLPGSRDGAPGRLAGAGVFCAPAVVALLLAALLLPGPGLPPVMNPGQVFFEGNNPLARGQNSVYPPLVEELQPLLSPEPDSAHLVYRVLARRVAGEGLTAAGANRFWAGKAAAFIADHPAAQLRLLARKALLILHGHRQHDILSAYLADRRLRELRVPAFPYPLLAALAVAGLAAGVRAWRELLPIYAVLALQAGVMLAFYVSERQRLPLLPFLVVFACVGAARVARRAASIARYALPVAACAVALGLPLDAASEGRHVWEAYDAGTLALRGAYAARERGDLAAASREAARAAAANPLSIDQLRPAYLDFGPAGFAAAAREAAGRPSRKDPASRFDAALLLLESRAFDEAAAALGELQREGYRPLRRSLSPAGLDYHLARCDLGRGDREGASRRLGRALGQDPGDPYVLALLFALGAERRHGAELFRYHDDIDAAFLLGRACLEAGESRRAADALGYVVARLPEFPRARVYLAAALGRLGRDEEAAGAYLQALALRADPALLEEEIVGVFRRLSEAAPGDDRRLADLGRVLGRYGHHEEAARLLRGVQGRSPSEAVAAELAWLERALRPPR